MPSAMPAPIRGVPAGPVRSGSGRNTSSFCRASFPGEAIRARSIQYTTVLATRESRRRCGCAALRGHVGCPAGEHACPKRGFRRLITSGISCGGARPGEQFRQGHMAIHGVRPGWEMGRSNRTRRDHAVARRPAIRGDPLLAPGSAAPPRRGCRYRRAGDHVGASSIRGRPEYSSPPDGSM